MQLVRRCREVVRVQAVIGKGREEPDQRSGVRRKSTGVFP